LISKEVIIRRYLTIIIWSEDAIAVIPMMVMTIMCILGSLTDLISLLKKGFLEI
jgi:hypothetical protein